LRPQNIIFITGTDTGSGKTLLTALLLASLRGAGIDAVAIKPFSSGNRNDAKLFHKLQGNELSLDEVNPCFFPAPLAPMVAARHHSERVPIEKSLAHIRRFANKSAIVLVEGCGGVAVPLRADYAIADFIEDLACPVLVSAKNRLGVINHTLLTVSKLQDIGAEDVKVVLMGDRSKDRSASSNSSVLAELLRPLSVTVHSIPFLGERASNARTLRQGAKKLRNTLAQVLEFGKFPSALLKTWNVLPGGRGSGIRYGQGGQKIFKKSF
jgi:dethiobiotin synthetase